MCTVVAPLIQWGDLSASYCVGKKINKKQQQQIAGPSKQRSTLFHLQGLTAWRGSISPRVDLQRGFAARRGS